MKERPIIFSAPMVRAILEGRKTVTRRVVKPQPSPGHEWAGWCVSSTTKADEGKAVWAVGRSPYLIDAHRVRCPYGQPGDRLWVRETHAIVPRTAYRCSEGVQQVLRPYDVNDAAIFREGFDRCSGGIRWRPSIHMPRWASRITLEITGVRVERLQDITEDDALAEGVDPANEPSELRWQHYAPHAVAFRNLWESINGAGSWGDNPFVWVVEFKRVAA